MTTTKPRKMYAVTRNEKIYAVLRTRKDAHYDAEIFCLGSKRIKQERRK